MSLLDGAWDWLEGAARDAVDFFRGIGEWVVDGVLTLPLRFNVLMANYLPGLSIGGAEYFRPSHPDPDVAATAFRLTVEGQRDDHLLASGCQRRLCAAQSQRIRVRASVGAVGELPSMRPWLRWLATSMSASPTHGRNDAKIKVAGFKAGSIIHSSTGYYPGVPGYGGETWLEYGSSPYVSKGGSNYYLVLHELGHALGPETHSRLGSRTPECIGCAGFDRIHGDVL